MFKFLILNSLCFNIFTKGMCQRFLITAQVLWKSTAFVLTVGDWRTTQKVCCLKLISGFNCMIYLVGLCWKGLQSLLGILLVDLYVWTQIILWFMEELYESQRCSKTTEAKDEDIEANGEWFWIYLCFCCEILGHYEYFCENCMRMVKS